MKHTLTSLALAVGLLVLGTATSVSAQQVQTAVGGRIGSPFGLSAKYFITPEIALEGIATARFRNFYNDFSLEAAGLYHLDLDFGEPELELLKLYVGAGAGATFFNYNDRLFATPGVRRDRYGSVALNLRGYVGVQYAFEDVPLELTVDTGPGIYAGRVYDTFYFHYSIGIRYILSRQ